MVAGRTHLKRHAGLHRFVKMLVAYRARRDVAIEEARLTLNQLLAQSQLLWHGVNLNRPDWSADSHSIAFTASSLRKRFVIHAMLNAYWERLSFELPSVSAHGNRPWRRWIDTSLPSPDDIYEWERAPFVWCGRYGVEPRTITILIA